MSERVVLNTQTNLLRSGSDIGIYTFYTPYESDIDAFISNTEQNINGIPFLEGELGFTFNNWEGLEFELNEFGELIITGNEIDSFSINSEGYLIYTEP